MEFNKQNIQSRTTTAETHVIDEGLRAYMLKVYNYLASGIFLTGIIYLFLFFVFKNHSPMNWLVFPLVSGFIGTA